MNRPKVATYYARLKVAQDAPPEVVRAAYRALAQKYHPDHHQGSIRHEVMLAALNKAYEVLMDPARRAAHDQWIREEEIRLGWREPSGEFELGLGLRLELALAGFRDDGLPLGDALRLHLTRGQRAALLLGAGLLAALLIGGAMGFLLMAEDDPLQRLGPMATMAPPIAYPASAPP